MKFRTSMICVVLLGSGLQLFGQQADADARTMVYQSLATPGLMPGTIAAPGKPALGGTQTSQLYSDLPRNDDSGTYTSFDAPGAGGGRNQGTFPFAISPGGAITGYYSDASSRDHGFLRNTDGTFATFDVPGATSTLASSINPAGTIAGYYLSIIPSPAFHSYLRAPDGRITTFDVPGARWTRGNSINPQGAITGTYYDGNLTAHGFLRDADGTISTFDAPGAGTGVFQGTYGVGINPGGTISGCYADASSVGHGFVRDRDGTITTFDVPGGMDVGRRCVGYSSFPGSGTAINNGGAVTGTYFQPIPGNPFGGNYRGFLRNTDGTFTTFDAATYPPCCIWTFGIAINPEGAIVGYQNDGYSINHGFLRTPDGTVTTLDAPGAGTGSAQGTIADGINPDGWITGWWIDAGNVRHGFLWTGGGDQ